MQSSSCTMREIIYEGTHCHCPAGMFTLSLGVPENGLRMDARCRCQAGLSGSTESDHDGQHPEVLDTCLLRATEIRGWLVDLPSGNRLRKSGVHDSHGQTGHSTAMQCRQAADLLDYETSYCSRSCWLNRMTAAIRIAIRLGRGSCLTVLQTACSIGRMRLVESGLSVQCVATSFSTILKADARAIQSVICSQALSAFQRFAQSAKCSGGIGRAMP